jgi:glyoxylase-like metal-dependent hydrolase (beta-lactamase superfamily II)
MQVHTLDLHFQDTPGLIAAYLLESEGQLALVETGPGSTLEHLRAAIRERGFDEARIRDVFVTHIHLDHAGAAGWWAARGARVFCHPNARRHLLDPSRLLASARLVYGAETDSLWGDMVPAPAERVIALEDGESVRVGAVELTALDTPGHARHHHAFAFGGCCFTGDAAGVRLEGRPYLSVTSAPPQFDPLAYQDTLDRLLGGGFHTLYLTHFGEVSDVERHLRAYRERVAEVHAHVRDWVAAGLDARAIQERHREAEQALAVRLGVSDALWRRYEQANGTGMGADGIRLFVEKQG